MITVEWTVLNDGLGDQPGGSWYDAILLSTDPLQDAGDRLITEVSQPGPLPAGETYTRTHAIEIPIDFAGPEIYVLVLADRWNWVYEADNDNNVGASDPFEVAWGLPDLVVDSHRRLRTRGLGRTAHRRMDRPQWRRPHRGRHLARQPLPVGRSPAQRG